jgi:hypothetical protein
MAVWELLRYMLSASLLGARIVMFFALFSVDIMSG